MDFLTKLKYWYFTYFELPTQTNNLGIVPVNENKTTDKYLYFKKFESIITTSLGTKMLYTETIACTGKDNKCDRFIQINNFMNK